jgi:hypothetical protein
MSKKSARKAQNSISIRDIKGNSGTISIANQLKNETTNNGVKLDEVTQAFEAIYAEIEKSQVTPATKSDLKEDVQEVQAAIKEKKVDESFVSRRLRNIGRMAPDILEVILVTITSPAAGLGMVGKKIAEKVKGK